MNLTYIETDGKRAGIIATADRLSEIGCILPEKSPIYIVHDINVACHVEKIRAAAMSEGRCIKGELAITAGENEKNFMTVTNICRWLLESGADRNAFVLAVGGGITSDMGGFAASVYKRGIRFGYVATTLLAQVDAAIGGKNGVNLDSYKNIIGVIRQPEFTFSCMEVLETLPYKVILSGLAEMLKTFIIGDRNSYFKALSVFSHIRTAGDRKAAMISAGKELQELIYAASGIKAGIVGRDQYENGERRKLNLGHTFAHAIEKLANEGNEADMPISHGDAVATGMILAARLSDRIFRHNGDDCLELRLVKDFLSCGLPTECPYPVEKLTDIMKKDKKAENGTIHFVLIENIGNVTTYDMTAEEASAMLV